MFTLHSLLCMIDLMADNYYAETHKFINHFPFLPWYQNNKTLKRIALVDTSRR